MTQVRVEQGGEAVVEFGVGGEHGFLLGGVCEGGMGAPVCEGEVAGPGAVFGERVGLQLVIEFGGGLLAGDVLDGPFAGGEVGSDLEQVEEIFGDVTGAEEGAGLGVDVDAGADVGVGAHGEGAAGEEGFDGGDAAAFAAAHEDGDFGVTLHGGDLFDGEGFVVFDGLRDAEGAGFGADGVEGSAAFLLADENDAEVSGQVGEGVEELPVAFEVAPIGDHDEVDGSFGEGFGLVEVWVDPIAGEGVEDAEAGMEEGDFWGLKTIGGLDPNHAREDGAGEGESGVVGGGPTGGEDEVVVFVEPGAVFGREAEEETGPVVFEVKEQGAFFSIGTGAFEDDASGEGRLSGNEGAVTGESRDDLVPEIGVVEVRVEGGEGLVLEER